MSFPQTHENMFSLASFPQSITFREGLCVSVPQLHPWLSTLEALSAAKKAVQIPLALMGGKALVIGHDELLSEALAILTECALPPREIARVVCAQCGGSLEAVRKGAKFCSKKCKDLKGKHVERGKADTVPARTQAHIGIMWTWPEEDRAKYAIREVGYALNNYLRTRRHACETPAGETLANMNVAVEEPEETPREVVESFLESRGVHATGEESFEELCQAARSILGRTGETAQAVPLAA